MKCILLLHIIKNYEALQHVQERMTYASVTFATVVVRFICIRFFGIVGSYKLRRMCLHCLRSPYNYFGDKLGQNLTETLQISYANRKVIVQSSCYLYKSHDAFTITLRNSQ